MDSQPHGSTSQTIYINPRFKNAHINPNFLQKPKAPSAIHVNPKFLNKDTPKPVAVPHKEFPPLAIIPTMDTCENTYPNANRKFIRPGITTLRTAPVSTLQTPLIKLGSRKLVRASEIVKKVEGEFASLPKTPVVRKAVQSKYKIVKKIDAFKIDRRVSCTKVSPIKKIGFVGRYALNRASILTPKKIIISDQKLHKIGNCTKQSKTTQHKTLEYLEINGLRYKSSKNKLQKADKSVEVTTRDPAVAPAKTDRNIFIRGDKYQLVGNGVSLIRSTETSNPMKRIDLGGFTFVARSPNTFVRTDVHRARSHLLQAKQKSIQCLSRRSRVKSNMACPIFKKLGRCVAFDAGKCHRVHDRKHVTICSRFLKGCCSIDKCLLSHDVTLSKMPTCKFYLQGCCVKTDCPYLHKKVGEKTEICQAFVNGFCADAEQCKRRHEFPAKLLVKSKSGASPKLKKTNKPQVESANVEIEPSLDELSLKNDRYFGENDAEDVEMAQDKSENDDEPMTKSRSRPRLGDLPAFIPLE